MKIVLMSGITLWTIGVVVQTFAHWRRRDVVVGWIAIAIGAAAMIFAGLWFGWSWTLAEAG